MPAIRLMMVLLPLPDGPVIATISPAEMATSTPLSAENPTPRLPRYTFSTLASPDHDHGVHRTGHQASWPRGCGGTACHTSSW
jgi:hypothetical protein